MRIIVCLFLLLPSLATSQDKQDEDERVDDILPDVASLYEETEHYIDPNDMFADFREIRNAYKTGPVARKSGEEAESSIAACGVVQEERDSCNVRLELLNNELQTRASIVESLQRRLAKDDHIDYLSYYRRLLKQLWSSFHLQDPTQTNSEEVRYASIPTSPSVALALQLCIEKLSTNPDSVQQCDKTVSSLLSEITVLSSKPRFMELSQSFFEFDFWSFFSATDFDMIMILVLGGLLLTLVGVLVRKAMVSDNKRPLVLLILAGCFVFCCLWNWRAMVKDIQVRRAAELQQRIASGENFDDIGGPPKECEDNSWMAFFKGSKKKCLRYYTDVLKSPAEEVFLEDVFIRTFSRLLLGPLRILGKETGGFFKEFYDAVPFLYLMPASIMIFGLIVIGMFLIFFYIGGYSFELPFFLGGLRTSASSSAAVDFDALSQQLRAEVRQSLSASHAMMEDIGRAVAAQQAVHPILSTSYQCIQSRLDQLICSRLAILDNPKTCSLGYLATKDSHFPTHSCKSRPSISSVCAQGSCPHGVATNGCCMPPPVRNETKCADGDCCGSSQKQVLRTPSTSASITCKSVGQLRHCSVPSVCCAAESSHCDDLDGIKNLPQTLPSENNVIEDTSSLQAENNRINFYEEVRSVLSDSLNESETENYSPGESDSEVVRHRKAGRSCKKTKDKYSSSTISPVSTKFLKNVQGALES